MKIKGENQKIKIELMRKKCTIDGFERKTKAISIENVLTAENSQLKLILEKLKKKHEVESGHAKKLSTIIRCYR